MVRRALSLVPVLVALLPAPAGAQVATVGDAPITQEEFAVWHRAAARGMGEVLDPPAFRRCVASKLRRDAHPHLHGDRVRLRRRCVRDNRAATRDAMKFLIESLWVEIEAALTGIEVGDRRVRRTFERHKRQAFRSARAYRRWLRHSGMTEDMLLRRTRLSILQGRLVARVAAGVEPSDDPQVRARREVRAISRYVTDFHDRWRSLTRCARGYSVRECGSSG
jgi:hypothetical protein